jgi:hypothetical protein
MPAPPRSKSGIVLSIWSISTILIIAFSSPLFSQVTRGEPHLPLIITARNTVHETQPFEVTVTSNNTPVVNASVTFYGTIQQTDSSGHAFFTAPTITPAHNLTCTINASKEGYEPATATITVIHVPTLLVNVSKNGAVLEGENFFVTVYDGDTHQTVKNATVRFDGKEYRTNSEGIATIPAPHGGNRGGQDYALGVSKPGYTDSHPQVIHIIQQPPYDYSNICCPLSFIVLVIFIVLVVIYDKLKHK